mmetsp:Transcript_4012/g.14277  ORF Transcript_4012/g.14277 Transcript_4012/m.14277 type:complete len:274 (+) Transcript_4012:1061-1882(+)
MGLIEEAVHEEVIAATPVPNKEEERVRVDEPDLHQSAEPHLLPVILKAFALPVLPEVVHQHVDQHAQRAQDAENDEKAHQLSDPSWQERQHAREHRGRRVQLRVQVLHKPPEGGVLLQPRVGAGGLGGGGVEGEGLRGAAGAGEGRLVLTLVRVVVIVTSAWQLHQGKHRRKLPQPVRGAQALLPALRLHVVPRRARQERHQPQKAPLVPPVTGEAQEQHRGPGQLRLAAVTASAVGAAVQVVHRAARGLGAQLDGGLQVGHHHNAGALHLGK